MKALYIIWMMLATAVHLTIDDFDRYFWLSFTVFIGLSAFIGWKLERNETSLTEK